MTPVFLDTGYLIALEAADGQHHAAALFSRGNLVVVGGRADWCLYYHHDDVLTFSRDPDFAKVAW